MRSPQDDGLVKGLGLTSATMLVMGSMIGSGIFIVSAEIAREVDSPALLIGAWAVAGFMTIVAALSYGELAAMMPRAGGQYVYLREALGPLWGFLYGWTLFLVIQTGTIAAVGVAFGKFLGVFFPSHFFLPLDSAYLEGPTDPAGADGSGQHGCRNQYAEPGRHPARGLPFGGKYLRVKTGALIQNVFTAAKVSALLGLGVVRPGAGAKCSGSRRELRRPFLAECGIERAARGAGGSGRAGGDGGDADDSGGGAGGFAVFRGRLE